MIKRLYRLFCVLLILGIALYIVLLNREPVTLNLGNGQTYSAPLGAMIIFIFASGVVCTALVASLFGFRAYLRERSFLAHEKRRTDFAVDSSKARGLTLSGQYVPARRVWESLVRRDPGDVQSRLWLARTLEADGHIQEALKVMDAARAAFPGDFEVLFQAALLNKRLGNKTAAVDNLALILVNHDSEMAARDARDLSVELNRFADALEYNARLERFGANKKELREFEARIRFNQLSHSASNEKESGEYVQALKQLVRDFPESAGTLVAVSQLEVNEGNYEAASQALVKAAMLEETPEAWKRAIDLWLQQKQPERALSVARLAIKEAPENARQDFELLLAKLYLQLGMYSDARGLLDELSKSADKSSEFERKLIPLVGICLLSSGQDREAAELWRKVA